MSTDNKEKTVKTNKSQLGRTKMLAVLAMQSFGEDKMKMLIQRDDLLVNGFRSPIPHKILNQRQKRKLIRQTA